MRKITKAKRTNHHRVKKTINNIIYYILYIFLLFLVIVSNRKKIINKLQFKNMLKRNRNFLESIKKLFL